MNEDPTVEQYAKMEAYVLSIPALANMPHYAIDDPDWEHQKANNTTAGDIRQYLNLTATGFYVWKRSLGLNTIYENGFDWVQVDNLTVGKARIWDWLFGNGVRNINPSKLNVRAGIEECWKGTSAMLAVRAAVLAHCKTTAISRAVMAAADGVGTEESPATITWTGTLSNSSVLAMMVSWGWHS